MIKDGEEFLEEYVINVAKSCVAAAIKAPKITGRMKLVTKIITGEEIKEIQKFLEKVGKGKSRFVEMNAEMFKDPSIKAVVVLGTNAGTSELAWNCGACGFKTCAELNKAEKKPGPSGVYVGPNCIWKLVDFEIACDWAAAAAGYSNVDNRVMTSVGFACMALGYIKDVTMAIGIPLAAHENVFWTNPKAEWTYEYFLETMKRMNPGVFFKFVGTGRPVMKEKVDEL